MSTAGHSAPVVTARQTWRATSQKLPWTSPPGPPRSWSQSPSCTSPPYWPGISGSPGPVGTQTIGSGSGSGVVAVVGVVGVVAVVAPPVLVVAVDAVTEPGVVVSAGTMLSGRAVAATTGAGEDRQRSKKWANLSEPGAPRRGHAHGTLAQEAARRTDGSHPRRYGRHMKEKRCPFVSVISSPCSPTPCSWLPAGRPGCTAALPSRKAQHPIILWSSLLRTTT